MTRDEILREFQIDRFDGTLLAAEYDNGGYDGTACVLYTEAGKLWWVRGSHCSCYGLERQWDPDEVTVDQLRVMCDSAWCETTKQVINRFFALSDQLGGLTDPYALAAAMQLIESRS